MHARCAKNKISKRQLQLNRKIQNQKQLNQRTKQENKVVPWRRCGSRRCCRKRRRWSWRRWRVSPDSSGTVAPWNWRENWTWPSLDRTTHPPLCSLDCEVLFLRSNDQREIFYFWSILIERLIQRHHWCIKADCQGQQYYIHRGFRQETPKAKP